MKRMTFLINVNVLDEFTTKLGFQQKKIIWIVSEHDKNSLK